MHHRPNLQEAIQVMRAIATHNDDAKSALLDYETMLKQGKEFLAARMLVDIVDHYYHLLDLQGIAHG